MKTKISMFILALMTMFMFVSASHGDKVHWIQDYEKALNVSKETDRPVLLFFTGSGWCVYCKKLEQEVFNTDSFAHDASDKYVFVKMDFAHTGKAKNSSLAKQHEDLALKHKIEGFPTVVLVDAKERVLLKTGYRQGGGTQYAAHLNSYIPSKQHVASTDLSTEN